MIDFQENYLEEIPGVYKITNLKTGKLYIGESNNIRLRFSQHYNSQNSNTELQSDIKNYGLFNFEFEVLEYHYKKFKKKDILNQLDYFDTDTRDSILDVLDTVNKHEITTLYRRIRELYFKQQYDFSNLYNCILGLEFQLGNPSIPIVAYNYEIGELEFYKGINHAVRELRKKGYPRASSGGICQALNQTEKIYPDGRICKVKSAYQKVWCYLTEYEENFNILEEKLSKCRQLKKITSVLQYDSEGYFIAEFPSAKEAEKQTGINNGNIGQCCKGNLKTAGGFIWKYKD